MRSIRLLEVLLAIPPPKSTCGMGLQWYCHRVRLGAAELKHRQTDARQIAGVYVTASDRARPN